jgi:hypothetical protein
MGMKPIARSHEKPERRRVKPCKVSRMETGPLVSIYMQSRAALVMVRFGNGQVKVTANLQAQAKRILPSARAELVRRGILFPSSLDRWTPAAVERFKVSNDSLDRYEMEDLL